MPPTSADGKSAHLQVMIRQMVENFLFEIAKPNAMALAFGFPVAVIDAGACGEPVGHPALNSK